MCTLDRFIPENSFVGVLHQIDFVVVYNGVNEGFASHAVLDNRHLNFVNFFNLALTINQCSAESSELPTELIPENGSYWTDLTVY